MTTVQNTSPTEHRVKSNSPFPLTSPRCLWAIKSGSMAVFSVITVDGVPQGARRFLFEVKAGDMLFGIPAITHGVSQSVFAVAYEETHLIQLNLKGWLAQVMVKQKRQLILHPLQQWSDRLSSIFKGFEITLNPLVIAEPVSTAALQEQLEQLHLKFLTSLQELEQQDLSNRIAQYQKRQELNEKATEQAINELTAVFRPQESEFFQEGTSLVIAAGAVGKALGLTIRPPGRSEDMKRVKEPLDAIARASQIRTRRVILAGDWWNADCGPLLAYKGAGDEPIALLPQAGRYEVFDPELKQRFPFTPKLANEISPIAYTFYRSFADKALKSIDVFKFVMQGQQRDLIVLLIMGLAASLLGMVAPLATGILIDKAIPDANRTLLLQIALGMMAVTFGKTLFEFVQGSAMTRVQTYMNAHTQAAVWDRLLKVRVSFFRQYSSGDMQSRVSAINQIRQILSGNVLRSLLSGFFAFFNLGLLFMYSIELALVALAIAIINIIVTTIFAIVSRKQMMANAASAGARLGLEVQLIDGISKLRVAGAEERAFAFWAKRFRQQTNFTMMTSKVQDGVMLFNAAMTSMSSIAIYSMVVFLTLQAQAATANLAIAGTTAGMAGLSIGTFLAFNAAFGTFITGASSLSNTIIDIMDIAIMWKRAEPILKELPEVNRGKADPGRLQGGVRFDRVSFRYCKEGSLTLDRVSLEAKPGEFIALVGPSGSGKSTTVRLLLGFEKPEDGTIAFDGQDLSGLDVTAVRRQLGVVLQNGRLNSASIFENISAGALITMDEAWEVARLAGFAEDVENMPMGMHTVVSEGGTNLSGGQRQRLLITRALVLKPKVLIFDEATSALDNRTQAIVSESLDQLNVTRIVIAHRLSTIRNADRIYVLQNGQVMQQGTFDELMHHTGLFADLMSRQVA